MAIAVYEKIRTGRRTVMYHADVAKLMPFTWLFMLFLAVLDRARPPDRHPPSHGQPLRVGTGAGPGSDGRIPAGHR